MDFLCQELGSSAYQRHFFFSLLVKELISFFSGGGGWALYYASDTHKKAKGTGYDIRKIALPEPRWVT